MPKRWIVVTAGLIAVFCLVGASFFTFQQIQIIAHPPTLQPIDRLRLMAHNTACLPPAQIVPGSFQVDPPQTVGDWLVLTDTVWKRALRARILWSARCTTQR